MQSIILFFTRLWAKLFPDPEVQRQQKINADITGSIDEAKKEMEVARCLFNQADDPDLIDHAIFSMEAAQKKYIYLYKMLKSNNCHLNITQTGEWR